MIAAALKLSGLKNLGWGSPVPHPNFLRPESYRSAASLLIKLQTPVVEYYT